MLLGRLADKAVVCTRDIYCTMKQTKRQRQVGQIVKRHFSQVLMFEGRNIYGNEALVTVTNVFMTPDMGIAKIYLSIFNVENKQEIMLLLENELQLLKTRLASRVKNHLRRVPDIWVFMDDTLDEMYRLSQVFDKLHEEKQMGDESPAAESAD